GGTVAGVGGEVRAMRTWDPDGAGPAGELLVLGGRFQGAGDLLAANVVAWDPATGSWSMLGTGTGEAVNALATLPHGDLLAAGEFTTAGGVPANRIARWNGSSWSAIGSGTDAGIAALAVLPTGDLVAAGSFTTAGGIAAGNIARWNGTAWSPLGAGLN